MNRVRNKASNLILEFMPDGIAPNSLNDLVDFYNTKLQPQCVHRYGSSRSFFLPQAIFNYRNFLNKMILFNTSR